jgi:ABC-type dipeptide/oligopeptide/nickel transport system ATPase component
MSVEATDPILRVQHLRVAFDTIDGPVDAVRDISFDLPRGKTLAIVGESGSGKSVTGYSILRLIQKPGRIAGGTILFRPRHGEPLDLLALPVKSDVLYRIRGGKISMIFQEPMTALSPVHTIGNQLCEAILLHRSIHKRDAEDLAANMLERVGIGEPRRRLKQYPFEFSGGMRQRVVIAMALVCRPEILIADEPTTAIDVTIQAQILTLIRELQQEMGTSVIFITHDLGVVAHVADDVAVMRRGRILETAPVRDLFRSPYHPYTRKLLSASPHAAWDRHLQAIGAEPAVIPDFPAGFGFEDSNGSSVRPVMHRFGDGRQLLLWPTASGVNA